MMDAIEELKAALLELQAAAANVSSDNFATSVLLNDVIERLKPAIENEYGFAGTPAEIPQILLNSACDLHRTALNLAETDPTNAESRASAYRLAGQVSLHSGLLLERLSS